MKNILLTIVIASIVFGVYWMIQDYKWREANCEKIYYKRKTEVCVNYVSMPIMVGKVVIIQQNCIEYKDVWVLDWKYKCPEKK